MHQIIASPISFVKLYKHQSIVIAESAADVSCQIMMRRIHFPAPLLFESIESESEFSTSKRSSVLINAMWGWENKCTHLDARKMTKIYRKSFKRGKEMPCLAVLHIVFALVEDIIPEKNVAPKAERLLCLPTNRETF